MVARKPVTDMGKYVNGLYDEIRGTLGSVAVRDPEAAERYRAELAVIFEALRDEARVIQRLSRGRERRVLYEESGEGRMLKALGIPLSHRVWKRIEGVRSRARMLKDIGYTQVVLGPDTRVTRGTTQNDRHMPLALAFMSIPTQHNHWS